MNNAELAAMLGAIADSIEDRGATGSAGVVRVAARRLAQMSGDDVEPPDARCAGCGVALLQPTTGRPRRWCPAPSCQEARKHPGKTRQNVTVPT